MKDIYFVVSILVAVTSCCANPAYSEDFDHVPVSARSRLAQEAASLKATCDEIPDDANCNEPHDRCNEHLEDADCDSDFTSEERERFDLRLSSDGQEDYYFTLSNPLFPLSSHVVSIQKGPIAVTMTDGSRHICDPGLYARLEDASIWRILVDDSAITQGWLTTDRFHLLANRSWFRGPYNYYLYNTETQTQVRIMPVVGPSRSHASRLSVEEMNQITKEVLLSDSSKWEISSLDSEKMRQWLKGDNIVIGVNDDWLSFKRPNLLINLSADDYVRVRWEY